MDRNKAGFGSIDEYIASFPPDIQARLEAMRATIRAAAPDAEEKISYGMPTFFLTVVSLIEKGNPRLCWGDLKSLTNPGVV